MAIEWEKHDRAMVGYILGVDANIKIGMRRDGRFELLGFVPALPMKVDAEYFARRPTRAIQLDPRDTFNEAKTAAETWLLHQQGAT